MSGALYATDLGWIPVESNALFFEIQIQTFKWAIVVTPFLVNYAKAINSGYSHISEPTQELHSRAAPSVRGIITAQSVQLQGEIPEEGRRKNKKTVFLY